jgi:hypothetical protein
MDEATRDLLSAIRDTLDAGLAEDDGPCALQDATLRVLAVLDVADEREPGIRQASAWLRRPPW